MLKMKTRERIEASFQWVNKLFVPAYVCGDNVNNENSYRYFLPRLKIKKIITLKLMIEIFMIFIIGLIKQYDIKQL